MTDNKDAAAIAAQIRTCIREGEPYETVVQVATQAAKALERRAAGVRRQALEEAAVLLDKDAARCAACETFAFRAVAGILRCNAAIIRALADEATVEGADV